MSFRPWTTEAPSIVPANHSKFSRNAGCTLAARSRRAYPAIAGHHILTLVSDPNSSNLASRFPLRTKGCDLLPEAADDVGRTKRDVGWVGSISQRDQQVELVADHPL